MLYIDGILPKGPYPPCLRMADGERTYVSPPSDPIAFGNRARSILSGLKRRGILMSLSVWKDTHAYIVLLFHCFVDCPRLEQKKRLWSKKKQWLPKNTIHISYATWIKDIRSSLKMPIDAPE